MWEAVKGPESKGRAKKIRRECVNESISVLRQDRVEGRVAVTLILAYLLSVSHVSARLIARERVIILVLFIILTFSDSKHDKS